MKTYTIGNLKGGTAKTTSAANLAYCLSHGRNFGSRVLVIDADPQSNLTPFFARGYRQEKNILDVLSNPEKTQGCICRSRYDFIDIIKGSTQLRESHAASIGILQQALQEVKEYYEYCIIDTRPAFECLTNAAVYASDALLTPVCLDKFCRDNLALVEEYLDGLERRPEWHVFATKVDCRRKSQKDIYTDLRLQHDYPFLESCIRSCAAVNNALNMYKPLHRHRSDSTAAHDYLELAYELCGLAEGGAPHEI